MVAGLTLSGVQSCGDVVCVEEPWADIVGLLCTHMMLGQYSKGIREIKRDKIVYESVIPYNVSPWEHLGPEGIGIWCMLSGARYGTGFLLHVPGVYAADLQNSVARLNEKCRWDIKIGNKFIYVPVGSSVVRASSPYIHEYYYKRVGIPEKACGSWLRAQSWYNEIERLRKESVHPLISRKPFIGSVYRAFDDMQKKQYLLAVFNQVRVRGFPYVSITDEERQNSFELMKKAAIKVDENKCLKYNNTYNVLPNSFMNHRYRLRVKNESSPLEVFHDDRRLKRVLKVQLSGNTNINDSNIRAALSTYETQAVGQFNPLFAKFFCELYCVPGGTVMDPCAGFGARLCGCVAAGRKYIGVDPSTDTYLALQELIAWFRGKDALDCSVIHGCGEDPTLYDGLQADMAITSPPYFDREEYSEEDTQSSKRYPAIDVWLSGFLAPMIRNTYNVLRPGCVFVLNIDNVEKSVIIDPAVSLSRDVGFQLEKTYYSSTLIRPGTKSKSSEPFFVFRKPS
jgi:DNA modification methylase